MAYLGGKSPSGVHQTLINLMPPHRTYIELFLGGGGILLRKRPAELNIGIDRNPAVIAGWLKANRDCQALKPPVLDRASVETRIPASTGKFSGRRRRGAAGSPVIHRIGRLTGPAGNTGEFEFRCADAFDFLERWDFSSPDVLIYADPPYLLSSRSACDRTYYHYEMSDVDHLHLLRCLRRMKCKVMISGYPSRLYDVNLKGWHVATYKGCTRAGRTTECVWCNFPPPAQLHDYRYVGKNYRDREDIQRQQKSWVKKLRAMPLPRQHAMVQVLTAAISGVSDRSEAPNFPPVPPGLETNRSSSAL